MRRCLLPVLALLVPCCTHEPQPVAQTASSESSAPLCDPARVLTLVNELGTAEPHLRPDIVARSFGDACETPAFLQSYFALAQRLGPGGPAVPEPDPEQWREAFEQACPAFEAAMAEKERMSKLEAMMTSITAHGHQTGMAFDVCDFARFGIVDREAHLDRFTAKRQFPFTPAPFVVYQWLLEQGVAPAQARPIAQAIVLFDRRERGPVQPTPELELPMISLPLDPMREGATVYVTRDSLRTSSEQLLKLDGGSIEPADVSDHVIGALHERLELLAKGADEKWYPRLWVVADATVPYATISDVLLTSRRAGFNDWLFVMDGGVFEYGVVPVKPPPRVSDPATLIVTIDMTGFVVLDEGSPKRIGLRAAAGHDAWDFDALTARAREHGREHPDARIAAVSPDGDLPYGVVARTYAALRGPNCRFEDQWSDCAVDRIVALGPGVTRMTDAAGTDGRTRRPRVSLDEAMVVGTLGNDIIHLIVRAHLSEVRYCYNQALAKDPSVAGKIVIRFEIDAAGEATRAELVRSTSSKLGDVGRCVAKAFDRWKFPKPNGGEVVEVTYPIDLDPG